MSIRIRAAEPDDIPAIAGLLIEDARQKQAANPVLWALADDAPAAVADALADALKGDTQPFWQAWLLAEDGAELVGAIHSMLLEVPPIYAGRWGEPGLLREDCALAAGAPTGAADALLAAAEADLAEAGARLLLASTVPGGPWQACYERHGYERITLYLAKALPGGAARPGDARPATGDDIPGIVARSAENRRILAALDAFWTPHPDADARFATWMQRSQTLGDRDMLIAGPTGALDGYVIAQPASRLHFPPAHPIAGIGVIDDYFHADYADPAVLRNGGQGAAALLRAAEGALADRGFGAAFVVCPAAWTSKLAVLEQAGYRTALVWMIRRPAGA